MTNKPINTLFNGKDITCNLEVISVDTFRSSELPTGVVTDTIGNCGWIYNILNYKRVNTMNAPIEYQAGNVIYIFMPDGQSVVRLRLI